MKNIKILEDCILIEDKILVFGDLHLGEICPRLDESLIKETIRKIETIFISLEKDKIKIEKIIILGDLKHEFSKISGFEWNEVIKLLDYLSNKISKENLIIIKGNHDNLLRPILKKREIRLKDYYIYKKILFLHGNKKIKNFEKIFSSCKFLVLGHLHPAITLFDKYKKEKYKCFLNGIWKEKIIYILPSFSTSFYGYNLSDIKEKENKEDFFIIPQRYLINLNVLVYNSEEDKEYNFGKLKNLIK